MQSWESSVSLFLSFFLSSSSSSSFSSSSPFPFLVAAAAALMTAARARAFRGRDWPGTFKARLCAYGRFTALAPESSIAYLAAGISRTAPGSRWMMTTHMQVIRCCRRGKNEKERETKKEKWRGSRLNFLNITIQLVWLIVCTGSWMNRRVGSFPRDGTAKPVPSSAKC